MSTVLPSAKLPLRNFINNGSYDQRFKYAKSLNKALFKELQAESKTGEIAVISYRNALKRILPDNIKFHIVKASKELIKKGSRAYTFINGQDDTIKSYTIGIPYKYLSGKNNKNAKISSKHLNLIMHESFHVFASLANPKHSARVRFKSDKESEIYEKYLYTPKTNLGNLYKIRSMIKKINAIPLEERINFLQNCRYRLYEEMFAFEEEEKYTNKRYSIDHFSFFEKIMILEKLLIYNIRKARKENAKLINKQAQ